jgi:hypothetical protein
MILGLIVTSVGVSGIFAVFTDRATAGEDSLTSGELPHAAHLQIATLDTTVSECGGFVDDLTTGLFDAADVQAGYQQTAYVCLKNAGSADLHAFMSVIDLADVETDCTGDEAAAGDTTCGPDATPPLGELSSALSTSITRFDCATGRGITTASANLAGALFDVGALAVHEVACYSIEVDYASEVPSETQQMAQSDQTTWRFAFDGSTL